MLLEKQLFHTKQEIALKGSSPIINLREASYCSVMAISLMVVSDRDSGRVREVIDMLEVIITLDILKEVKSMELAK